MKKRVVRGIGIAYFIIGAFLVFYSFSGLTGFAVLDDIGGKVDSLVGLVFVVAGITLLVTSSMLKERYGTEGRSGLKVLVSNAAIERSRKDMRIRNNIKRYIHEIEMISSDPQHRPQEALGDFRVSPRGNSGGGIRVAWHRDAEGNIYIDDLLYHEKENKYVDNWAEKVRNRRITKNNYENEGYSKYNGEL